jgi:excisionase family DNA binding protein
MSLPAASVEIARVMTVAEAATELRCSKAHVHHLIAGKVPGVRPLPSLWLGRRRLILRASFEDWLKTSEQNHSNAFQKERLQ